MKKTTLIGIFVLLTASSAMAQNAPVPCNQNPGMQVNPVLITFIGSPEHATVTDYKIGVFADGVNPNAVPAPSPISSITVPKSALKAGVETNCWNYVPAPAELLLATPIAILTPYRAAVKAMRTTDNTEADWSDVSNPFVKSGPKPGPASVPRVSK